MNAASTPTRGIAAGLGQWRRLPPSFWTITGAACVARLTWLVIPFRVLYLTGGRHLTTSQAAMVLTLFGAGWALAQPVAGLLADRFGRRGTILAATVASSLFLLLFGWATTVPALAVAGLLAGMTFDLYRPAIQALAADTTRAASTTTAMCALFWAMNVSRCVGCLAGTLLFAHHPMLLFPAAAAVGIVSAAFIAKVLPRQAVPPPSAGHSVAGMLRDKRLVTITLTTACVYAIYLQSVVTMPLTFAAHGFTAGHIGLVLSASPMLCALVQPLYLPRSGNAGLRSRCAAGAAATAAGVALTGASTHVLAAAAFAPLWAAGDVIFMASASAIVATIAPPGRRAAYLGVWASAQGIGAMIAPMAASVAVSLGGFALLWHACLAAGVLACLAVLSLGRRRGGSARKVARHWRARVRPVRPRCTVWLGRGPARQLSPVPVRSQRAHFQLAMTASHPGHKASFISCDVEKGSNALTSLPRLGSHERSCNLHSCVLHGVWPGGSRVAGSGFGAASPRGVDRVNAADMPHGGMSRDGPACRPLLRYRPPRTRYPAAVRGRPP